MASSYTTNLRLVLPVQGELAGTWGDTVNAGLTNLVDTSVAGTAAVTMTDADYTLTTASGAADQARAMFISLTGTLTAARNVICPSNSKLYFVTNSTTGGFAITFKTSGGSGISVSNGKSMVLYCNGTSVVDAINMVNISAGAINGTTVGATTASTGAFTTLSASGAFSLSGDQVQVSEGGTGVATLTGIVKGNGTSAFSAAAAGTDYAAPNQTMYVGTTALAINRASASLSLTGVNIDGNAGTVTNGVYTTGDQTIAGIKTFSSQPLSANGYKMSSTGWSFTESAGVLYIAVNGVNKAKLDSSGNLTVVGNVTAYGTV